MDELFEWQLGDVSTRLVTSRVWHDVALLLEDDQEAEGVARDTTTEVGWIRREAGSPERVRLGGQPVWRSARSAVINAGGFLVIVPTPVDDHYEGTGVLCYDATDSEPEELEQAQADYRVVRIEETSPGDGTPRRVRWASDARGAVTRYIVSVVPENGDRSSLARRATDLRIIARSAGYAMLRRRASQTASEPRGGGGHDTAPTWAATAKRRLVPPSHHRCRALGDS